MCFCCHIRNTWNKLSFRALIVTRIWNPKDTFSLLKCGSFNTLDSHCHQPTDWLTPLRQWKLNHNVTLSFVTRAKTVVPLSVLTVELVDLKDGKQKWRFKVPLVSCFANLLCYHLHACDGVICLRVNICMIKTGNSDVIMWLLNVLKTRIPLSAAVFRASWGDVTAFLL